MMSAGGVGGDQQEKEARQGFVNAVGADLELLALLHDREPTREILVGARACTLADQLGLVLTSEDGKRAIEAFDLAMKALPGQLDDSLIDELAAGYADIYLCFHYRISPTESVWSSEEGLERQEPMFRARDAYTRRGLKLQDWAKRTEDHLVIELRYLAFLFSQGGQDSDMAEAARFLDEHLLRWVGKFSHGVVRSQAPDYFKAVALLTSAYLEELRDHLVAITGKERPVPQIDEAASARDGLKRELTCGDPDEDDRPFMPGIAPSW